MSKFKNFFVSIWENIKNTLFPEYSCYICGIELQHPKDHICENCKKELIKQEGNVCLVCGDMIPEPNQYCDICKKEARLFDMARSCYKYNEASSRLVMGLKYSKQKFLVPFMAKEMLLKLEEFGAMPDIIIPVPLSDKRQKERGFNQSELLAYELADLLDRPNLVNTNIIKRSQDRIPQAKLSGEERRKNLIGAFTIVDKTKLTNKVVLIVDDVFTTGSTVSEISRMLLKLKPKAILVLTFAKT